MQIMTKRKRELNGLDCDGEKFKAIAGQVASALVIDVS
jgi:hypothetical protein